MAGLLAHKLRRDIWRQKGQFLAVIAAVALGVALFGGTLDAYQNLKGSFDRVYANLHLADVMVTGPGADQLTGTARALPGGPLVEPRLQADLALRVGGRHKQLGRLVSLPVGRQPQVNRLTLRSGAMPASGQVLVEQHFADHFGLRAGAALEVLGPRGWTTVRVSGVAVSAEYLWPARSRQEIMTTPDQFGVLFAPEPLVRQLAPSATIQLGVYHPDRAAAGDLIAQVRRIVAGRPGLDVTARPEQPSVAVLAQDVDAMGSFSWQFPLLFLLAAIFGTYILLSRLVYAQRAVIGTLLASGLPRRAVVGHYLEYGLVAGLAGGVVGAALSPLLGGWFAGRYATALGLPLHVTAFHPATVVMGVAAAIAAALVAAYFPARAAAHLAPAEAMRAFAPTARGRRSLAERLAPPLRRVPTRWRMIVRGLARNRRRSAFTVAGIVIATGLVMAFFGLRDTVNGAMDRQFTVTQREDAQIQLAPGAGPRTLASLAADPAVAAVEPMARYETSLAADTARRDTLLIAFPRQTAMHRFIEPGGRARDLPTDGALVGEGLRQALHLRVGDPVTLTLPAVGATLRTRVAGFVDEPMSPVAYVALDRLDAALGHQSTTGAYLRLTPNVDARAVGDRLAEVPGVAAYLDTRSLEATMRQTFGLYDALVGLMIIIGALMAAAMLFTTMSANISERVVELGTLRAAGMGRGLVSRLVAAENLLLTALGIPLGLLAGYAAGSWMMASFSTEDYSWTLHVASLTPLYAALGIAVTAVVTQFVVFRAVGRIDIARIVRERSL